MYQGNAKNDLKMMLQEVRDRSARDQLMLSELIKAIDTDIMALNPVPPIPNILRVLGEIGGKS